MCITVLYILHYFIAFYTVVWPLLNLFIKQCCNNNTGQLVSKMWLRKGVLDFFLLLILKCGINTCSPLNYSERFEFKILSINHPLYVIAPGNRDEITDISDIFNPDTWFPIEINVPDTFIAAWQNIESAWSFASDYFSMSNDEMSTMESTKTHYMFEYFHKNHFILNYK